MDGQAFYTDATSLCCTSTVAVLHVSVHLHVVAVLHVSMHLHVAALWLHRITHCQVTTAVAMMAGNMLMGYGRDASSSYTTAIYTVVRLALVCTCITLLLIWWDRQHGGKLNMPRRKFGLQTVAG